MSSWYPTPKKPGQAGVPKRLGLVRAIPWADFAVISALLGSIMIAIFPGVTLS